MPLHEVIPASTAIGLLVNPTSPVGETLSNDMQAAARVLGRKLHILHAAGDRDFDTVFTSLLNLRPVALVITTDAIFIRWIQRLAELALRHAVPAIFQR
jgi:putative ABC transport system substrate-binding protein